MGNDRSLNQIVGGILGAVFVLVGGIGFLVSGGHEAMGHEGGHVLGIFEVNVAHNVVHLAVGAALIVGTILGAAASRAVNAVVGGVYLAVGLAGLFLLGTDLNVIALNGADNALHLVVGALLLLLGLRFGRATTNEGNRHA